MRAAGMLLAVAAGANLLASVSPAAAQPRERVYVGVSGAAQLTRHPFTDGFTFDVNRERGNTDTRYPVEGGPAVDAGVAFRLWQGLAAGVSVTSFTRDVDAEISSRLPHPFFFSRHRELEGITQASRTERAIHAQALYRLPLSKTLAVWLFGGPSFVRVEQDVVAPAPDPSLAAGVRYDEAFPYDAVTFRSANVVQVNGSATGFHAGADAAWMFNRHVGIGAIVRYTAVTVDVDLPPSGAGARRKSLDAGGALAGGGIRIAF